MDSKVRLLTKDDFEWLKLREYNAFPEEADIEDFDINHFDFSTYEEWFANKRNASFIFEDENGEKLGVIAVILVNQKGWDAIHDTNDKDLDEYKITGDNLFNPESDKQVGFHVYMIEKFDQDIEAFTTTAYQQVIRHIQSQFNISLDKFIGLSGYSVSPEAINVALNKLSRVELKLLSRFMMIDPIGKLTAKTLSTQHELEELLNKGYKIRNRCRLTSVTPKHPSIIWTWFN